MPKLTKPTSPRRPRPVCLESVAEGLEAIAADLRATHAFLVADDDSDDLAPPHRPARKATPTKASRPTKA
jgi:hypothetical protein